MRIGIIGLGNMGLRRFLLLRNIGYDGPVFGYDINPRRLEMLPRDLTRVDSLPAFWRYRPDIVFVSTPPDVHLPMIEEAARHDARAVFVEKPLSIEDPGVLPEFGQTRVMVGCNTRYHEGINAIERWRSYNRIGLITHATMSANYDVADVRSDWRDSYIARTGAILDAGIHFLDLARWWFGNGQVVEADIVTEHGIETASSFVVEYSGIPVHYSVNIRAAPVDQSVIVAGQAATACYEWSAHRTTLCSSDARRLATHSWPNAADALYRAYVAEMNAFLDLAQHGGNNPNNPAFAADTVRLALSVRAAARATAQIV